jgi:hypothetical protein
VDHNNIMVAQKTVHHAITSVERDSVQFTCRDFHPHDASLWIDCDEKLFGEMVYVTNGRYSVPTSARVIEQVSVKGIGSANERFAMSSSPDSSNLMDMNYRITG